MKDYPTLKLHAELLAAQGNYNELFCATKTAHRWIKLYAATEFGIKLTVDEAKKIQEIIDCEFGSCGYRNKAEALRVFRFKSLNGHYPHQQV